MHVFKEDIDKLKKRLNEELSRRNKNGSLEGWNKDFTILPEINEKIIKNQLAETKGYASGNSNASYGNDKKINYNEIEDAIIFLENGQENSTGCNNFCTGLCTSTCADMVSGVINCDYCTTTCYGLSYSDCGTNCSGMCNDACLKICGISCGSNCSNTCSTGCSTTCDAYCYHQSI